MFSIIKNSITNEITVSTSVEYDKHQMTLIPSSDATIGTFYLYALIDNEYVLFKDEPIPFDRLQPVIVEGRYVGFKFYSETYNGTSLKLEYKGE